MDPFQELRALLRALLLCRACRVNIIHLSHLRMLVLLCSSQPSDLLPVIDIVAICFSCACEILHQLVTYVYNLA
jgi:hypothetical protein